MVLGKDTICNLIEIQSPRWKKRVVGIATFRVGTHNEIHIKAVDKMQRPYYPEPLYGSGEMIKQCEVQGLPSGVNLYLVPISKLETLERR